jgi:hypothetical protein
MIVADKATGALIGQTVTADQGELKPGELKIHTGKGTRIVREDEVRLIPFD